MSKDDRTEAPTPKRKREARRKGQIAKSTDLVTWTQILIATYAITLTVSLGTTSLRKTMVEVSRLTVTPDLTKAVSLLGSALLGGLLAVAPLGGAAALTALLTTLAQTGLAVTPHKLKPSAERLNPMKGLKRLFSKQGAWEATKEVVRSGILALVAWGPMKTVTATLVDQNGPLRSTVATVAASCIHVARSVAYAGIVMGVIDYAVQKRRLVKSLKMTKQEVKDEYRQSEGDPQMKAQRRARALELRRNRMMSDVKRATAVVVNPTHVAVAISYDRSVGAPVVLAKGTGTLAQKIRAEAERHQIPVVRNVALARALNAVCEVGEQIPVELYEAVARLLAFVMTIRRRGAWQGAVPMDGPSLIPEHLAQLPPPGADQARGARRAPRRRGQGRPRRNEVQ